MSEQILVDKHGHTREFALAALIVGCLLHEEYIRLPEVNAFQADVIMGAIRLTTALLKNKLNDEAFNLPVDY